MAKKVDFSSIVESKGESTWYKKAIDETARYRQAKEIEVEKLSDERGEVLNRVKVIILSNSIKIIDCREREEYIRSW